MFVVYHALYYAPDNCTLSVDYLTQDDTGTSQYDTGCDTECEKSITLYLYLDNSLVSAVRDNQ